MVAEVELLDELFLRAEVVVSVAGGDTCSRAATVVDVILNTFN
jgi:hypothetical protein